MKNIENKSNQLALRPDCKIIFVQYLAICNNKNFTHDKNADESIIICLNTTRTLQKAKDF